ncbi:MAG: tRNA pseudouridine(55) synthase TruB [Parcubacteria group bacterium]|nr:tRNA pseudouridine(55) synthase TruB [Parcubacteria group bacterium]
MLNNEEVILIDKPKGITSFDVIRKLQKELGIKNIGHAGTLDPLATGLLIIGVGSGTKKLNEYLKLSKVYCVDILVGESRTTGDLEGEIIEEAEVTELDEKKVKEVLKGMVGTLKLAVPKYSAIKVDGEPLYKKARRGESFKPPIKEMVVHSAKSYDVSYDSEKKRAIVKAEFNVGSGTYIRSLAEEFGRRIGYPATVAELRRISIGDFKVEDAQNLDSN